MRRNLLLIEVYQLFDVVIAPCDELSLGLIVKLCGILIQDIDLARSYCFFLNQTLDGVLHADCAYYAAYVEGLGVGKCALDESCILFVVER